MGLTHFVQKLPERGIRESGYILYEWLGRQTLTSGFADETVFDREWDILVIYDACRLDLFCEASSEYEWLPRSDTITDDAVDSVAGSSQEWMERTTARTPDTSLANTAYITGNPFSAQVFGNNHPWGLLDEQWRQVWDDEIGTIRPEPLIKRGIEAARNGEYDHVIIHLMQPHAPFINYPDIHAGFRPKEWGSPEAARDSDDQAFSDVWHRIKRGELDYNHVWRAYADNLRIALDATEPLLNNADGKVALTADHGNALGERGLWGHPDVPAKSIREVPWVTVEAIDEETVVSDASPAIRDHDTTDTYVKERLQALGYT